MHIVEEAILFLLDHAAKHATGDDAVKASSLKTQVAEVFAPKPLPLFTSGVEEAAAAIAEAGTGDPQPDPLAPAPAATIEPESITEQE